jgi:hypothetical protein
MIACAVPEGGWPDEYNKHLRPGRYKECNEKYAGDNDRLNLSNAQTAIVMLLSIIMVMEGEYNTEIAAEK